MSLLLDALKKAAEKNASKDASSKNDDGVAKVDLTELAGKTIGVDDTKIVEQTTLAQEPEVIENITEFELAQIINEQKEKELNKSPVENDSEGLVEKDEAVEIVSPEDKTDIKNLTIDDINESSDPSLALYEENEDPSLKLALSDEEILLTDDDVTEFLGGDELSSRLDNSLFSLEGDTNYELEGSDESQSLNLVDSPSEHSHEKDDTTTGLKLDLTSTTTNAGQTTNLNSLTNDATLTRQDSTSTQTFASDNYDRTLVKLDDDVSKVFTGMKSAKAGAAMTPDFAKKVFVHKSTSLRRKNYKIYAVISVVVLITVAVLALFEMQTQIDDIDTSLVRLKQNPVPTALRFQRKEKNDENTAILDGRIDTEALNLLKSLTQKNNGSDADQVTDVIKDQTVASTVKNDAGVKKQAEAIDSAVTNSAVTNSEVTSSEVTKNEMPVNAVTESTKPNLQVTKPTDVIAKIEQPSKVVAKKEAKPRIKIETKLTVSKESIWLKDAFTAFENGDMALAEMNYERVLSENSSNRDALLGQAAIFASQNKGNQAIDNYQAILLENPKDPLAMASLIAASSMSPIESESRLKLLQRESPRAAYLQFALGNVISAQNRWQEAQQYYYKAYQLDANNPDYAYNLAVSLEQINKPEIAINYYTEAINNAQVMHSTFNTELIKQRIEVLKQ